VTSIPFKWENPKRKQELRRRKCGRIKCACETKKESKNSGENKSPKTAPTRTARIKDANGETYYRTLIRVKLRLGIWYQIGGEIQSGQPQQRKEALKNTQSGLGREGKSPSRRQVVIRSLTARLGNSIHTLDKESCCYQKYEGGGSKRAVPMDDV